MRRAFLVRIAQQWPRQRPGLPRVPHGLELQMARVAQWFHAASDTTRLSILEFLSRRDRSAGELHQLLRVPRSRVSFHLKVLRESGLIRGHRVGRSRIYGLRGETLDDVIEFTRTVLPGAHTRLCPWSWCR